MNRSVAHTENRDAHKASKVESNSRAGTRSEGHRIPELDGLRGIAIGLVIIWHYLSTTIQVPPGSPLQYLQMASRMTGSGVDLFFVLSGFLIGGILLDARGATNYFGVFYRRRFLRIVPIYSAVLLVFPMLGHLRHSAHATILSEAAGVYPPAYMYWTLTQNFWMAAKSSLGTNSLGMTWSLAVEEQFYLTLPALVSFLSLRQLRRSVIAGIVLAPLFRLAIHFLWPLNWGAAFVLMPCRADALLLGVFAAILLRDPAAKARIQNSALFSVAFPVLLAGTFFLLFRSPDYKSPLMSTVGYTWLALLYVAILVYAVTRPTSPVSRILRLKSLCWLGSIAYGTYLLHQAIQRSIFRLFSIDPPAVTGIRSLSLVLAAFALAVLVARLSWTYFEKPLVRIGQRVDYKV